MGARDVDEPSVRALIGERLPTPICQRTSSASMSSPSPRMARPIASVRVRCSGVPRRSGHGRCRRRRVRRRDPATCRRGVEHRAVPAGGARRQLLRHRRQLVARRGRVPTDRRPDRTRPLPSPTCFDTRRSVPSLTTSPAWVRSTRLRIRPATKGTSAMAHRPASTEERCGGGRSPVEARREQECRYGRGARHE